MKLPSEIAKRACQVMTPDCIGQKYHAIYDYEIREIEESERAIIEERDKAVKERNALLERAEKAEKRWKETLVALDNQDKRIESLERALENSEAQIQKWIPVGERLPEDGEYVIADNPNVTAEAQYVKGVGFYWYTWSSSDVQLLHDVTHWMPLPNSPTE